MCMHPRVIAVSCAIFNSDNGILKFNIQIQKVPLVQEKLTLLARLSNDGQRIQHAKLVAESVEKAKKNDYIGTMLNLKSVKVKVLL